MVTMSLQSDEWAIKWYHIIIILHFAEYNKNDFV